MKGTSILEVLFIIGLMACLILPFVIFHLWHWAILMGLICLVFGIMELEAYITTHKTLSQQFWKWSEEHRWQAWVILGVLAIGWIMLLAHLSVKLW